MIGNRKRLEVVTQDAAVDLSESKTDPSTNRQAVAILPIEPLISRANLETILQVDGRTIDRMRSAGRLPKPDLMVSRFPRWRAETIRAWIAGGGK